MSASVVSDLLYYDQEFLFSFRQTFSFLIFKLGSCLLPKTHFSVHVMLVLEFWNIVLQVRII